MAGGLTTEAHSSPIPTYCSCCNQAVVPGTDHILWSCPTFDSYRRHSRPPDELEARLGWGQNGPKQHLIIQMGQIRAVYAEESVRLGLWRAGGRGGGASFAWGSSLCSKRHCRFGRLRELRSGCNHHHLIYVACRNSLLPAAMLPTTRPPSGQHRHRRQCVYW